MFLLTAKKETVVTECPCGHERLLTLLKNSAEQWWTLTCPICGAEHELFLPEIIAAEP